VNDGTAPGLFEYATEEINYTFRLNIEFCEFAVWRAAYDEVLITFGGLSFGGNFDVYVWRGGEIRKKCVNNENLVKYLLNWPVIVSSGCIVTTIQQSDVIMRSLGATSKFN